MKSNRSFENIIHGVFLLLGLITVGCVLLITVYLVISGIPALREIGLIPFLFGPNRFFRDYLEGRNIAFEDQELQVDFSFHE